VGLLAGLADRVLDLAHGGVDLGFVELHVLGRPGASPSPSHSTARAVTLSLRAPAWRSACSTSSGTASPTERLSDMWRRMSTSLTELHSPSEHSSMRSPFCSSTGPLTSIIGLPGLPRHVNSTWRLKRSAPVAWRPSASCSSL
jgi:hypothetical protein